MASNEDDAYDIMQELGVDYVLGEIKEENNFLIRVFSYFRRLARLFRRWYKQILVDGANRRGRAPESRERAELFQRARTIHGRQEHVKNDEKLADVQIVVLQVSLFF